MDLFLKEILWKQFGAAIDMLENAINMCTDDVWSATNEQPEFWYITFHTLFWLDFYLSESPDNFTSTPPFTLSELDPEGILPNKVYTKEELLRYLEQNRNKCKVRIEELNDEKTKRNFVFGTINLPFLELILYNMRHVQHHTAQLNLLLRQKIDSSPGWVKQTKLDLIS
jgi:DinB superfamily